MKKLLHNLGPVIGLLLFTVALLVLRHELRAYHYHDVIRHLGELPTFHLLLALVLTILGYLVLTGYDTLALHYIHHPLAYRRIALASFVGYAFSNNMGHGLITGGSVRYRLYSAWGLSTEEITKVVIFSSVFTFHLGLFTVGGLVFLLDPLALPASLHLPFASVRPLGMVFLLLGGGYLGWSFVRNKPLRIGDWEFPIPEPFLSLAQIVVASLDWALAGSVLYALLPSTTTISYPQFLGIFLLAQTAGLVSMVPGGLGVFETVLILLLSPRVPTPALLGSLLAYRGIYYLLPLSVAAVLFGTYEIAQKKEEVAKVARIFGQWVPDLIPNVLAFTTFVSGAILLWSGATPAVGSRLALLVKFVPLPALEISHFLGSIAGVGLLLLARGLQRRIDVAYYLATALLGAGIVFSFLKGFDYKEAVALVVMLGVLLPCRRHFYRKASLLSERFTSGWIFAIAVVLLSTIWLGMFSYKHMDYSHELWWYFALKGNAPRFLRASAGAIGAALLFAFARLLRPAPPEPALPGPEDLGRVLEVVEGSRDTSTNLALLGDKTLLFNEDRTAFIMYAIEGRSWVALGDPVGPKKEWEELVWRFSEICERHDGRPVFYEVSEENLSLYLNLGLTLFQIGEEALVPLETFSLEGSARKGLRRTVRTLEKEGCSFEVIPKDSISSILPELKFISDGWLEEKNTREKGFSLGFFKEEYLKLYPAGVVKKNGKIVAFANIWPGAEKEELSADLMRYLADAPDSVMEYLFIELMLWGQQEGYRWFNMGMAPLSGLEDHELAPLWNRLGTFIFRHGEHFYNFQGLRKYKDKFDPEWRPKYLASPGGLLLPRVLTNVASLISGGFLGIVTK